MKHVLSAALAALLLAACATDPVALHTRTLTLDTHVDIPLDYMPRTGQDGVDPGVLTQAQVDLPKMVQGVLDAAFFIIYTPQTPVTEAGHREARQIADTRYAAILRLVDTYPDRIALARTADEVEAIVASGKLAALIGMENAYPLRATHNSVSTWAARGVRYVGLTHFGANAFGDSSGTKDYETDAALTTHGGLSDDGRTLIGLLNDYGIMVDISHAGDATALQAMELSRTPVIASHSGVDGVFDHPRNLSDALLDALRTNNGVVQLVSLDGYVKAPVEGLPDGVFNANISDYIDHIDYAVARIGIDHVGIASDFDGGGGITGWEDATRTPAITAELVRRGYSNADIAKIWGGNLLRVMRTVEAETMSARLRR